MRRWFLPVALAASVGHGSYVLARGCEHGSSRSFSTASGGVSTAVPAVQVAIGPSPAPPVPASPCAVPAARARAPLSCKPYEHPVVAPSAATGRGAPDAGANSRPPPALWKRMDASARFHRRSLLLEAMEGERRIEDYRVWASNDGQSVVAYLRIGEELTGHPGIVHGSVISVIADDLLGCLFDEATGRQKGFSGNLCVSYRAPWKAGQEVVFQARVVKVERRKYFLEGRFYHAKNPSVTIATATGLYIKARAES